MKVANRHLPIALQRGSPDLIRAVHRFPDRLRGGMTRATPVEASLPSLSVIASSPLLPTARNQASINASIIEFAYRRPFTRRNHDKTVSRY